MTSEMLTWIDRQKPELVRWAEEYVEQTELFGARDPGRHRSPAKVSGNQLRNLLNAAQSGSPLAVIINLLRYQIGRESKGWPHKPSGRRLEQLLARDLRGLVDGHIESLGDVDCDSERYELEALLAAQLIGFIIRDYTYHCALAGTRS